LDLKIAAKSIGADCRWNLFARQIAEGSEDQADSKIPFRIELKREDERKEKKTEDLWTTRQTQRCQVNKVC
jgi:hypothetical protein